MEILWKLIVLPPPPTCCFLCSREDAGALPSLFQRSSFSEDTPRRPRTGQRPISHRAEHHLPTATALSSTNGSNGFNTASTHLNDNNDGGGNLVFPSRSNSVSRHLSARQQHLEQRKVEPSEIESGFSSEPDGKNPFLCCWGGGYGTGAGRGSGSIAVPSKAGFWVQTEAILRRLLLRAVRHPLLLMLHFGGSLAMAVCLGTIFQGKLAFTFDGAQSR